MTRLVKQECNNHSTGTFESENLKFGAALHIMYMDCTRIITTIYIPNSTALTYHQTCHNSLNIVFMHNLVFERQNQIEILCFHSLDISSCITDTHSLPDFSPESEIKFIVLESSLNELFRFCPQRGSLITEMNKSYPGSNFIFNLCCHQGHNTTWPIIDKMAAGNLLISASILFSGRSFAQFDCVNF